MAFDGVSLAGVYLMPLTVASPLQTSAPSVMLAIAGTGEMSISTRTAPMSLTSRIRMPPPRVSQTIWAKRIDAASDGQ